MWGELLFSGLITAFGIAMYAEALNLPEGLFGTLGPGYFPKIILACMIVASGSLFLRQALRAVVLLKDRQKEASSGSESSRDYFKRYRFVAFTFAAFFLYLFSMKWLGFLVSTLTFMLATMWMLAPADKNWGTVRVVALTSVLFTFGLYSLFTFVFSVMLPAGILF